MMPISAPHLDVTLEDLQDLATRQQQQIDVQQQLLASKEQQLRYLKLQDQRQHQDISANTHDQEAKLQRVQALRSQVEQKRLSNAKMVEEIGQITGLFQQKQQELLEAVARVEELSDQLEALRSSRLESSHLPHHHNTCSAANLERLYKELQLRNMLNQDQSVRLQQQRDSLNKKNLEVASMDRRLAELRQRLWSKKAALQQKENFPLASDPQHALGSRVAAVGPYIKSSSTSCSQGPPVPSRQENLVKPAYPDGTATLPMKAPPRPAKPASGFSTLKITKPPNWHSSPPDHGGVGGHSSTLPRMARLSGHGSGGKTVTCQKGPSPSDVPPAVPSRTNHSTENLLREVQAAGKGLVPPPLPSKPKPFLSSPQSFSKFSCSTGTLPDKMRGVGAHFKAMGALSSYSNTLPLPHKQETPPAATVRPYTPDHLDGPPPVLRKPQTLAASSIYSMYTQQSTPGKSSALRSQTRVYGKPLVPSSGGRQSSGSDHSSLNSGVCPADVSEAESTYLCSNESVKERAVPRPLSPTKLLPFQFNLLRNPSNADLDAVRRRLHHAPRPLKKRNSITEPEGPAGPNIQKLLYQKTTLAAMDTVLMETVGSAGKYLQPPIPENTEGGASVASPSDEKLDFHLSCEPPDDCLSQPFPDPPPVEDHEHEVCGSTFIPDHFPEDFPPYPPPPYPSSGDVDQAEDSQNLQPPEVTGQVTEPTGKKSILRKTSSERTEQSLRVKFNPLAILLDSSLEGEYDLVQRVIFDVEDPSMPNDEGITALHNAVCAGHTEIVKFLVQFGVNVNAADSDGWTPLHCAASCNNVQVCKFLVESGAAVFATTYSDNQTAADKCEEMEDGYAQCSQFLYGVQEKMGVMNRGVVYALWDYEPESEDELGFTEGDCMTVLRRGDDGETDWWWACCGDSEGYIPRNLLGLYLRIKPRQRSLA